MMASFISFCSSSSVSSSKLQNVENFVEQIADAVAVFGGNRDESKAELIKLGGFFFDFFRFGFVGGDKNGFSDISQKDADFFIERNRARARIDDPDNRLRFVDGETTPV